MGCASSQPKKGYTKKPIASQPLKNQNTKHSNLQNNEKKIQQSIGNKKNQYQIQNNDALNKNLNINSQSQVKKTQPLQQLKNINYQQFQRNNINRVQVPVQSNISKQGSLIKGNLTNQSNKKTQQIEKKLAQQKGQLFNGIEQAQNLKINQVKKLTVQNHSGSKIDYNVHKNQSGIKSQKQENQNHTNKKSEINGQSGIKEAKHYQQYKENSISNLGYDNKQNQSHNKNNQIPTNKKSEIHFSTIQKISPQKKYPSNIPQNNQQKNKMGSNLKNTTSDNVKSSLGISKMGQLHVHSHIPQKQLNLSNKPYNIQKNLQQQNKAAIGLENIKINILEEPKNQLSKISQINDESLIISKQHAFDLGIQFNPQMLTIDMNRIGW